MRTGFEGGGASMSKCEYCGETNSTPEQLQIKKELEGLGYTNVHVWWEQIKGEVDGGYFFCSVQKRFVFIGFSIDKALEALEHCWFKVKEVEVQR